MDALFDRAAGDWVVRQFRAAIVASGRIHSRKLYPPASTKGSVLARLPPQLLNRWG